jgi:hypothetical protein
MERRYYLAKVGMIAVAMVIAFAGTGMRAQRPVHQANVHGEYSAPAEFQMAAWRATVRAGRYIACLASTSLTKAAT